MGKSGSEEGVGLTVRRSRKKILMVVRENGSEVVRISADSTARALVRTLAEELAREFVGAALLRVDDEIPF